MVMPFQFSGNNLFIRIMRFILVYKYGILQTKTERIDVNFCENTQQLLDYLEKRVGHSPRQFIVRIKKGKIKYRIIGGWPISHYGIKEGMEINLELLESPEASKQSQNTNVNQRYLNSILGFVESAMEAINEQKQGQNEEEEESEQQTQFSVRKYLDQECQKMLKEIQKKHLDQFLDIFQDFPEDIEERYLMDLKVNKPFIIDELGEKGWGAIHYAIFYKAITIFDELLDMEVDINKCTSDGWLPIQLAIDLKDIYYIQKLINQPSINLNIVTSKGTPLHMAAKENSREILVKLLEKDVDILIKDNYGKTAVQLCSDPHCINLLKKYEDKKQTYQQYVNGNLPLSLTTIVGGSIMKVKRPFMNLKERYILIDPFQGSFIRYQSVADYPKKPKEITPLCSLRGMKIIEKQDMSFYMKKEMIYFIIEEPNKEMYACQYKQTAQKWLLTLKQAVKFAQELQKNPQMITEIKKNSSIIEDKPPYLQKIIKKVKNNIFNLALGNRNSRSSVKTTSERNTFNTGQNNEYHTHTNSSHPSTTGNSNLLNNSQPQTPSVQPEVKKEPVSSQEEGNQEVKREQAISDRKTMMKESKQILAKQLGEITTNKVTFASFNVIKVLGSGAFGKVFLARLISNNSLYALKALKKKNLILQKQLKYAVIEANILKQANSQFIINLHFAFQTPHYLYLALDYCPGRDLSFHLARQVNFPQTEAKFYIAQLCLAIEHLHQKNIIYRDLKPENILLDEKGHIKLADFGLSKQTNDDKTKSFCGSPAYLSPEMLNQKGAGKESDLYGIGAVLYELLVGEPPYFSDDIPTLYKNIKEGKLKFPKNISDSARSLISGLLERDPKKRLGSKNWNQIKEHSFFSSINWAKLAKLQLKPPERPELENEEGSDDELDIIKNTNTTKFVDFDYDESTKKINRLMNFSFVRPQ